MKRQSETILPVDDLNVGDLIAVFNLKQYPEESVPIMGQAVVVKSIHLPFIVAEIYNQKDQVLTLDNRHLNFMRVSRDFADAQFVPRQRNQEHVEDEISGKGHDRLP